MRRAAPQRPGARQFARRRHDHCALPHRRPSHSWAGRGRLGPAAQPGVHRARGRRRARQPVGAGPLPHGRTAAHRGRVRLGGGGGARAAPMGGRLANRHPARGRYRNARRAGCEFSPDQAHQRWRDPPSHRPEGAAALRVPDGRRGRAAAGARGWRHLDHGPGRAHRPSGAGRGVHVSLELQLLLLAWGTLVGLDLISVPQMMIARPIVAGPVAGAILGDVGTGLALGVLFELFQYDVLPVGATRYPEYGPATVAAVSAAHVAASGGGGALGIGLGAFVGLVTGMAGGTSMHLVRRLNARATHAASERLEAGDTRVLVRPHVAGILRDTARAALLTALGLALAP